MSDKQTTDTARVYTLAQLANHVGGELRGPAQLQVSGIATPASAKPDQICFIADKRHAAELASTQAAVVMVNEQLAATTDRSVLICASPYLAYARASQLFDRTPATAGIHPSAVVHPDARIAADVCLGPNCVIEKDAVVAAGVVIGAGTVVGQRSRIGTHTRLHANVTLYHDVTIGAHCMIHSGVVLGADGFGFAPDQGRWERIAQNGGVVLGDGVSVGANTTIDRGAIGDTVIEDGVIIDNLCQIAHNVRIGRYSALAGTCGIAGSATIGAHCTLAGGAGMVGHVSLADGVHVAARTVITKTISQKGSWSAGTPTMPTKEWRRAAVRFAQLDSLAQRVAELEKKLRN
jgi:UDP-3-O-[3-hydroxymyristoyl] glucosamine N-acyltransferase